MSLLIVALIVIGILGRIIPHPANFTPIIAIALLASHVFKNKWIVNNKLKDAILNILTRYENDLPYINYYKEHICNC